MANRGLWVSRAMRTALRAYAGTIPAPRAQRAPLIDTPSSILVQNVSGIGNALMATPLLAELRRHFPQARIDFLTTRAAAQLLAGNPHVTSFLTVRDTGRPPLSGYFGLVNTLRKTRYEVAFTAVPTVGYSQGIRCVLARIPERIVHAYVFKPQDDYTQFYTRVAPWDQTRHDVESNLDLLRAVIGGEVTAGPLTLTLSGAHQEQGAQALTLRGWTPARTLVGFCPGSEAPSPFKRWPAESYVRLGKALLAANKNILIAVFCGPDEKDCEAYLEQHLRDERVVFVKDLALPVYGAALGRCNVVVSGDSLPMHLCAALQVPVVALFGATDPRRTGPWMARATILRPPGEAAPVYSVPYSRPEDIEPCMHRIGVDDVLEAIAESLSAAK